jgi:hypothetical protein
LSQRSRGRRLVDRRESPSKGRRRSTPARALADGAGAAAGPWRAFLLASAVLALGACAALGLVSRTPPPASFDLQGLIGRWQGTWTRLDKSGGITLDITDVVDRKVSGRMSLQGFSSSEGRAEPVEGAVFAQGRNVILSLTGAFPLDLTITGGGMEGTIPSAVPSMQATVALQKVF